MYRRALTTIVWFVAAWEIGSAIELLTGFEAVVAPALAAVAVVVAAVDPFGWLYNKQARSTAEQTAITVS